MNFATMVVVIVAIVAFTLIRIAKYTLDHRRSGHIGPPPDDAEKAVLRREVEDMRERIKVLERITTEANTTTALESRRVSDEIEALRDREHS